MKPLIDLAFRVMFKVAYKLAKSYWSIRKPETNGALVAIWYQEKILLVRTSYHSYYSLPGGYLKTNETAIQAAVRELKEEINIDVEEIDLRKVHNSREIRENHWDNVTIFELNTEEKPEIKVDNREVVSASFYSSEEVRALKVFPPILDCLRE